MSGSLPSISFLLFFPLVLFFNIFQTADHVLLISTAKYDMPHMGKRFVQNAPEAVVAMERKKQSDSEEKIASLKESIAALRNQ